MSGEAVLTKAEFMRRLGTSKQGFARFVESYPNLPKAVNFAAAWGGTMMRYRLADVDAFIQSFFAGAPGAPVSTAASIKPEGA
jgi:hypothetical protein